MLAWRNIFSWQRLGDVLTVFECVQSAKFSFTNIQHNNELTIIKERKFRKINLKDQKQNVIKSLLPFLIFSYKQTNTHCLTFIFSVAKFDCVEKEQNSGSNKIWSSNNFIGKFDFRKVTKTRCVNLVACHVPKKTFYLLFVQVEGPFFWQHH